MQSSTALDGEPVTVVHATLERGVPISPPPAGFVVPPLPQGIVITGRFVGDYELHSPDCDFCAAALPHPKGAL